MGSTHVGYVKRRAKLVAWEYASGEGVGQNGVSGMVLEGWWCGGAGSTGMWARGGGRHGAGDIRGLAVQGCWHGWTGGTGPVAWDAGQYGLMGGGRADLAAHVAARLIRPV